MVANKPDPKHECLEDFKREMDEVGEKAMQKLRDAKQKFLIDIDAWAEKKRSELRGFLIFNLVFLVVNLILWLWR